MDKQEEDNSENISVHVEPSVENSPHNTCKVDGSQRPNQRLLRLAKLNQGSMISNIQINLQSPNQSVEMKFPNTSKPVHHLKPAASDIPPPSYESVVKFNQELNTMHIVSSASQLPTYQDVGGLSDAPPSYHSIFTETMLRVIHPFNPESEDAINYNVSQAKFSSIVVNTLLFVFITSFVFLLPVSMITMGIIYVHECPAQPRLPIYLIVLGFFQMLECCGRLAFKVFQNQNSRQNESWRDRYRRKDPLIYFVIVWFIIGSMWVYQTDPSSMISTSIQIHNYNLTHLMASDVIKGVVFKNTSTLLPSVPTSRLSTSPIIPCDKTIYAFAFWIVTSYYSVIAFFFLLVLFDVVTRVVTRFCCPSR